jgi:hypothetical protein
MMRQIAHLFLATVCAVGLAACETTNARWAPKGQSAALADGMHPEIQGAFRNDYIHVIVKGTSAAAMEQYCRGLVRVKPYLRQSLQLTLRSNDLEFGAGVSRREIAKKVQEHRVNRDCSALASDLNTPSGYDNLFLEKI